MAKAAVKDDVLLTPREVARRLNVKQVSTVLRGAVGRALPWAKLSARCYRVPASAVDALLKARTAAPPPA